MSWLSGAGIAAPAAATTFVGAVGDLITSLSSDAAGAAGGSASGSAAGGSAAGGSAAAGGAAAAGGSAAGAAATGGVTGAAASGAAGASAGAGAGAAAAGGAAGASAGGSSGAAAGGAAGASAGAAGAAGGAAAGGAGGAAAGGAASSAAGAAADAIGASAGAVADAAAGAAAGAAGAAGGAAGAGADDSGLRAISATAAATIALSAAIAAGVSLAGDQTDRTIASIKRQLASMDAQLVATLITQAQSLAARDLLGALQAMKQITDILKSAVVTATLDAAKTIKPISTLPTKTLPGVAAPLIQGDMITLSQGLTRLENALGKQPALLTVVRAVQRARTAFERNVAVVAFKPSTVPLVVLR